MSSLAELPELVGFFSYAREDDEAFEGTLSALRDSIQRELSAQLGRSRASFRLWQDHAAIAPGKLWESEIKSAVGQSVFFIPIVTPRSINSKYCKLEFDSFLARERAIGRNDLVFPILYISVPALENEARWRDDHVLAIIGERQYVDWRPLRHLDVKTTVVRERIELLCRKIVETLNEPWVQPQQPRRMEPEAEPRLASNPKPDSTERRGPPEASGGRQAEEELRSIEPQESSRRSRPSWLIAGLLGAGLLVSAGVWATLSLQGTPDKLSSAVATAPIAQPPLAASPSLNEMLLARMAAASVVVDERERIARAYEADVGHKAIAVSFEAHHTFRTANWQSADAAELSGLEGCQLRYGSACVLVAVDDRAEPAKDGAPTRRDMPRTHYAGAFDLEQIPRIRPETLRRADVVDYRSTAGPKAVAIHSVGILAVVTGAASQIQAQEQALALCNNDPNPNRKLTGGPCFLYAVGNQVVLPQRLVKPDPT
jgi:hypothetical protein